MGLLCAQVCAPDFVPWTVLCPWGCGAFFANARAVGTHRRYCAVSNLGGQDDDVHDDVVEEEQRGEQPSDEDLADTPQEELSEQADPPDSSDWANEYLVLQQKHRPGRTSLTSDERCVRPC